MKTYFTLDVDLENGKKEHYKLASLSDAFFMMQNKKDDSSLVSHSERGIKALYLKKDGIIYLTKFVSTLFEV